MDTLKMEIALMSFFNPFQNIIVTNLRAITGHECDILILNKNNYATEIEIKISKSDLLADKKKLHGHYSNHIARFYFAVPKKLVDIALCEIPERAGLYSIEKHKDPKLIKQCKRNKSSIRWKEKERIYLMRIGAMRILGLKQKIAAYQF